MESQGEKKRNGKMLGCKQYITSQQTRVENNPFIECERITRASHGEGWVFNTVRLTSRTRKISVVSE